MNEPCEAWLRSKNHDKWAEAMVICEHPAGFCGADGYCHYGGSCFGELQVAVNEQQERINEFGEVLERFQSAVEKHPVLSLLIREVPE